MAHDDYDLLTTGGADLESRNPPRTGGVQVSRLHDAPQLRVRAIALDTDAALPEHVAGVPVLIHVVAGRVRFEIGGEEVELRPGALVRAGGSTPHTVTALEPSRLILTLHGEAPAQSVAAPHVR